MSAEAQEGPSSRLGQMRRSFRGWRGQRPFWGGLLTLLGGIPIMYLPYANLTLGTMTVRMATTAGAGSLIIGVLLVVLGLTTWFQKHSRVFAGVAAILLALVSLVVSNFGGFLVGFLLALIGGGLAISWAPGGPIEADDDNRPAGAAYADRADRAGSADRADRTDDADRADRDERPEPTPAIAGATYAVSGDPDDLFGNNANKGNGRHRAG